MKLPLEAFRKEATHSIMLDWSGAVVRQFDYEKRVANISVIDRARAGTPSK